MNKKIELKGGKMIKKTIFLVFLLTLGLFAFAFINAEEEAEDIQEIEFAGISSEDIQQTINNDTETPKDYKRIGIMSITRGNGWIENSQKGFLIDGFWINHRLIKIDKEQKEIAGKEISKNLGRLKIAGHGNYKLVKIDETSNANSISNLSRTITFDVIPMNQKKYLSSNESKKDSIGKLILTKDKDYGNMALWSGTLLFNNDGLSTINGNWNVKLASDNKIVGSNLINKIRKETKEERKEIKEDVKEIKEQAKEDKKRWFQFWKKNKAVNANIE